MGSLCIGRFNDLSRPIIQPESHPLSNATKARRKGKPPKDQDKTVEGYDVVVVDDDEASGDFLACVVSEVEGAEVRTFQNPLEVLAELPGRCPDLVITDNHMPELSGIELVQHFRADPICPRIPIMVVTADLQQESRSQALEAGANDFLTKPVDHVEVRMRVVNMLGLREGQRSAERRAEWLQSEVALATAEIVAREEETILSLARAVEYRDWETGSHIVRMARYSKLIAEVLGEVSGVLPGQIYKAAPLHDVGKIGVPDKVLLKPGKLTKAEVKLVQAHAEIGHEILGDCRGKILALASEIALTHHEHFDGSGYPQGLAGEDIPLSGRIVAVADVFDALSSKRPYKKAWTLNKAFAYVREQSGKHFDPACVAAFDQCEDEVRKIAGEYSD